MAIRQPSHPMRVQVVKACRALGGGTQVPEGATGDMIEFELSFDGAPGKWAAVYLDDPPMAVVIPQSAVKELHAANAPHQNE